MRLAKRKRPRINIITSNVDAAKIKQIQAREKGRGKEITIEKKTLAYIMEKERIKLRGGIRLRNANIIVVSTETKKRIFIEREGRIQEIFPEKPRKTIFDFK